jgi:hypothetical protein
VRVHYQRNNYPSSGKKHRDKGEKRVRLELEKILRDELKPHEGKVLPPAELRAVLTTGINKYLKLNRKSKAQITEVDPEGVVTVKLSTKDKRLALLLDELSGRICEDCFATGKQLNRDDYQLVDCVTCEGVGRISL